MYVFLADGFEEVEAITPMDFLRRADMDLITVSITADPYVTGGHGITVKADRLISDFDDNNPQALICPGGMPGAENLAASGALVKLLRRANEDQTWICAICAAPSVVLGKEGADILGTRCFTCYPGSETRAGSGTHSPERVVQDGKLITAIGAGAAAEFSLAIIEALKDRSTAKEIHSSTMQRGDF